MEKKYYKAYRDIAELFIDAGLNQKQDTISAEDALLELKKIGESDPESWDVEAIREQLKPYLNNPQIELPSARESQDEKEGCSPASSGFFLRFTFVGFLIMIAIFAGWKACNL